ncbi:MAG: DMT family transporter [Rhodobacteraceae bacterium]|nr:DMT family transporter [Paracoccaceae bacterium]
MRLSKLLDRSGLARMWYLQTSVMRGVLLMCLSTLAFAGMHVTVRHVSGELPALQIVFFRNFFALLVLLPVLIVGGRASLRTDKIWLHLLRSLINICAMMMFFTAVTIMPLAKATALGFVAPVIAAALSVLFLGERFRAHRWAAIGIGFVGMLIILRPGLVVMDTGSVLVVCAASLWAVTLIMIKILSRTDSSITIVAWMGLNMSLFSLGPALWVWQTPSMVAWCWLLLIGFLGAVAQVTLSQSLKETDPTAVLPFDFLKLIWAALLAAWLFDEIPDMYTLI